MHVACGVSKGVLVTAALVEHVRVCCRGSLGRARAASVTAARVSMCTRAVALSLSARALVPDARCRLDLLWSPVWARVGVRWTSVALAGGPSAGIVSHRCSLSMCTCAVAALVERARVGPGCSMPVGPVVVARVGSCCARVGLCRASVADAVRGPLARMHCGCVFVRIRCEGQPQGRCCLVYRVFVGPPC